MEMVRVRNLRLLCLFLMVAGFVMFRGFGGAGQPVYQDRPISPT
jgi:hypothetical protein